MLFEFKKIYADYIFFQVTYVMFLIYLLVLCLASAMTTTFGVAISNFDF